LREASKPTASATVDGDAYSKIGGFILSPTNT
jgi:hypothetical protein